MTFTPEQSTQRTQPIWATHGTPGAPAPRQGNGGLAATGFGLAAFGLLAGLVPFFGFLVTVPALLLSLAGRRRFRAGTVSESGLSRAGIVMGWIGIGICTLTTALLMANVEPAQPTQPVQPVAAPVPAPAPALLTVPNVVGMPDAAARDTLRAAGFTNVVLGPSTAPQPGVAAGTVTTQQPGATSLAATGDPIVLGEAAAPPPPAPVVVTQAPTTEPVPPTQAARPFVATPDVDADRPYVPAPRVVPDAGTSSGGGSSSGDGGAYYKNCAAAKAAGAAPISKGQPGYRSALDRDGDGTACDK